MTKVITYGTYDHLHRGHVRLLERAKALGDYLIVGVTSDDFDKQRGKINVQQSLEERIAAVRSTGLADKIVVEEYEGQKIDDIKRYGVDIFTVGSDWVGQFDYLNEYCKVVYLERTSGVSSTEIRSSVKLRCGLVGYTDYMNRVFAECGLVNGLEVVGICVEDRSLLDEGPLGAKLVTDDYGKLLNAVDIVYIHSHPDRHYEQVKRALNACKHVMCEAPIAKSAKECSELFALADERGLVLMDSLRTAYSTAYARMLLLVTGGRIGEVVSVDATITNLKTNRAPFDTRRDTAWSSMTAWGPTALLPIFQILGTKPNSVRISSLCEKNDKTFDEFSRLDVEFPNAVATAKVGSGAKSEGSLVVSGTKGYIYVPAPWWKTDYFEIRYEDPADNRRYFYQLDGEGIRFEWVSFLRMIADVEKGTTGEEALRREGGIDRDITKATCEVIGAFERGESVKYLEFIR